MGVRNEIGWHHNLFTANIHNQSPQQPAASLRKPFRLEWSTHNPDRLVRLSHQRAPSSRKSYEKNLFNQRFATKVSIVSMRVF